MIRPADVFYAHLDYLANDVAEQALDAHLQAKPAVSEALYGVSNALKRAVVDGKAGRITNAAERGSPSALARVAARIILRRG
jgi:hypothetical protein